MINQLHIFAQEAWHNDAYIVGDAEGLGSLKKAIEAALEKGKSAADLTVNDGEGYFTIVICVSPEVMETVAVPYTSDVASEKSEEKTFPYMLMDKSEYEQLAHCKYSSLAAESEEQAKVLSEKLISDGTGFTCVPMSGGGFKFIVWTN